MKRTFNYFVLALLFIGCSSQRDFGSVVEGVEFIELGYGICNVNTSQTERMDNTPTGVHEISSNFKLIKKTDQIPARIGQRFGVDYVLKSLDYKDVKVEIVWTFPEPIKNDKGKIYKEIRYINSKATNEDYHETYVLNSDYLIVKEDWKYQMFMGGKKLYERKFYLQ